VTLGATVRPWERAQRTGGIFNYFSARDFDPEAWHGEYPNPAFMRMTEADGAWMARILAHFDNRLVAAAVSVGAYDAASTRYLAETLIVRRDAILRRYLTRLSPIGQLVVNGDHLCGIDLARATHIIAQEQTSLRARYYVGDQFARRGELRIIGGGNGRLCVELVHESTDGGRADADPSRYRIVDIHNGNSRGPLRAHLYDLGPRRGFRLVGIERPQETYPPL
jgi:hypothetical protein